ncbi:MAG: 6-phosphogluconolactonase [Candidatus Methylomirabilia bacterium]
MSRIRTLADAEAVSVAAAQDFVDLAREAVNRHGRFSVALSGGSTPRKLYQLLAELPFRNQVRWECVEFFWGDERAVPPDHPDSNYGLASAALLTKLDLAPERIHRIRAERADRDAAAQDCQEEIARVLGAARNGPPPAFDLILLGMGADGHTASLFPESDGLRERRRWVVSHFIPKLGAERITLTAPILNRARQIRVLVAGADKAGALKAVLEGPRDPDRLPAQLVQPEGGHLIWLLDRAAASQLSTAERSA